MTFPGNIPTTPKRSPAFDGEKLALDLFDHWKARRLIEKLAPQQKPRSLDEAYAVQHRFASLIEGPLAGYRVELGSENAMRWTGLAAPVLGVIPKSRIFENHSHLSSTSAAKLHIEAVIAFIAGQTSHAIDQAEALLPVGAYIAIKLTRSRFTDWRSVGVLGHVADNLGFNSLILGDFLDNLALQTALSLPVEIYREGHSVATKLTGKDRPDPTMALDFFWKEMKTRDIKLMPGMVTTTGNLVADCVVDISGRYEVRIGDWRAHVFLEA